MEKTLQHETTTQCLGLPPTGPRNHRPDGTQANNALTFKLDHLGGADQLRCRGHFEFQRQAAQQMHKCDAFTALAKGRGTAEEC